MKFKESPYYNEGFLGKYLYRKITDDNEILTVQEFFRINDKKKEYHIKDKYEDHKLRIYSNYYELNCQKCKKNLYLVFDKPVHVTGEYCANIVTPKIIVKYAKNLFIHKCVSNKVIIDNEHKDFYEINYSKVNSVEFYNSKVAFWESEINNLFIFDKKIKLYKRSKLLEYHKIKIFGSFYDLKKTKIKKQIL